MLYSHMMVQPMREDLTRIGFKELLTAEDVGVALDGIEGTALVVVNSVCGCAAGKARPGVALALGHDTVPDSLYTVFAGMEIEATERVRDYFIGYPPSSPQIALFKDRTLVHIQERKDIEGREAEAIAADLTVAFDEHCGAA